jgi:hypothetical protein
MVLKFIRASLIFNRRFVDEPYVLFAGSDIKGMPEKARGANFTNEETKVQREE